MSDEGPIDHQDDGSSGERSSRRTAPAAGRRKRRRKEHGLFFKVLTRTIAGLFTLLLIGIAALVVIYLRTSIPQPGQDANKQTAIVYYNDGKTEMGRIGPVNRQNVPLSKVPKKVQYAFLAAEDRNFYDNNGVSPTGILRAAWADARGGSRQGGSTITQQYVKNYFLSQDKTVSRKVKEIMISIKIDRKYSKDQILDDYLNTIYFGRNAYGIQAASQAYFGVDSDKLTVAQGGFLASVINAPAYFDPATGPQSANRARARMSYVFAGMVKKGWLTQAESSALTFPTFKTPKPVNSRTGSTGFLVAAAEAELTTKLKLSEQDIGRSGLRITTTIDKSDQAAAVRAVKNNVDNTGKTAKNQVNAGLVAMKPDGAVAAMYGGSDYQKSQFNSATMAAPPGGSSFKVFALTAAQQQGISLDSTVSGANYLSLPGEKKPVTNDQNESFGQITLRTALTRSVNTAFVRLNLKLGTGKTLAAAKLLGIPATDRGMNKPSPRDTLGEADVHVIDMATAYNTINAGGKKSEPHFVQKVTSETGSYNYTATPNAQQVVSSKIADNVASAMAGPISDPYGTAYQTLKDFGRPAGGKTGTTDNFRSAWFTGFTPGQLTTSVGMYAGNGDASSTLRQDGKNFYGGVVPTEIWKDFMTLALQGQPVTKMPAASNLGSSGNAPAPSQTQAPSTTTTTPSTTQSPTGTSTTSPSSSTTTSSTSTSPSTSTAPKPTSTTTRVVPPPVQPTVPNPPNAPGVPGATKSAKPSASSSGG